MLSGFCCSPLDPPLNYLLHVSVVMPSLLTSLSILHMSHVLVPLFQHRTAPLCSTSPYLTRNLLCFL
ncbi:hypothetical protein CRENBAI_008100 [Crenichthys baileyi]|uniref:Uncharacterized protein n=1 Tax=Crenichthys baileyi TaxID=28760 RepID=A0AAV9RUP7_9TELE